MILAWKSLHCGEYNEHFPSFSREYFVAEIVPFFLFREPIHKPVGFITLSATTTVCVRDLDVGNSSFIASFIRIVSTVRENPRISRIVGRNTKRVRFSEVSFPVGQSVILERHEGNAGTIVPRVFVYSTRDALSWAELRKFQWKRFRLVGQFPRSESRAAFTVQLNFAFAGGSGHRVLGHVRVHRIFACARRETRKPRDSVDESSTRACESLRPIAILLVVVSSLDERGANVTRSNKGERNRQLAR